MRKFLPAAIVIAAIGSSFASAQVAVPLDADARKEVVEQLANALADSYAYEDIGRKLAQHLRTRLADKNYAAINSGEELATALNADLHSVVPDKHLNVSFDARPGPQRRPPRDSRASNGDIRSAKILAGNVGYLEVNAVPDPDSAREVIAAAFSFLKSTDALILDLRANSGGWPATCALYMSYLSEGAPYVLNTFHGRGEHVVETRTTDLGANSYGAKKPVFVLISANTFSGGEELAYDIQSFKRGLIVGEVSGGGANPGASLPLSRGFTVFMPTGYPVNPVTGTNWEGVGVKPDAEVPPGLALLEAHRLALTRLQADATDPLDRDALQALARGLAQELRESASRAPNYKAAQMLVGTYGPPEGLFGPRLTVSRDAGYLVLQLANRPANRLIPLSSMSFRLDGLPEDFTATFETDPEGRLQVWLHMGDWPPQPPLVKLARTSRPR
ncbi:MAG: S41 family peptidase [Pseudomonadota bacterium]